MLFDRRVIKSQTYTDAMTLVLCGRGSFSFSVVCKITRTSSEESDCMCQIWISYHNSYHIVNARYSFVAFSEGASDFRDLMQISFLCH